MAESTSSKLPMVIIGAISVAVIIYALWSGYGVLSAHNESSGWAASYKVYSWITLAFIVLGVVGIIGLFLFYVFWRTDSGKEYRKGGSNYIMSKFRKSKGDISDIPAQQESRGARPAQERDVPLRGEISEDDAAITPPTVIRQNVNQNSGNYTRASGVGSMNSSKARRHLRECEAEIDRLMAMN